MASSQLTPQDLQKIRELAAQWGKIVARRAFGDSGPGLDVDSYTPDLLRRILTLAGRLRSAEQAAIALEVAADVAISGRHVQRLLQEVGDDLARQRDEQAARYRRRALPAVVKEPPALA